MEWLKVRNWLIPVTGVAGIHVETGATIDCDQDGPVTGLMLTLLLHREVSESTTKQGTKRIILFGREAEELLASIGHSRPEIEPEPVEPAITEPAKESA